MANVTLKRWNGSAWVEMLTTPASHTHTLANIPEITATAAELNVLDGITATTAELNYTDGVTSNIQTQLDGTVKTTGNQTIGGLKTFSGGVSITEGQLNLNNLNIANVGTVIINDPGPNEGIEWINGNFWKIYESPNDLTTSSAGNLQIVQNTTRRGTFNTSGQLELPVATGTSPLLISSTTAVTNLNADLLDGNHASAFVLKAGDTMTGQLELIGSSPQIKFSDDTSGAHDFWIHVNSNNFYVLTDRDNNGSWDGAHALRLQNSDSQGYLYENKIWTAGNDGTGSTLDADLLDGNHASAFYLATNPSGYQTAAEVSSTVAALVDSAPGTLDTLNELAAALGDDPNFATTVTTSIAGKVAKTGDTMTGTLTSTGFHINDTNTRLIEGDTNAIRLQTNNGYIDVGAQNAAYAHIYSDRPEFYFNKQVRVLGDKVFHDGYHPNADTLTTARTLTIGSTGKTFNGSANVAWSLGEIGAAAASHTHAISDVTNLQSALDSTAPLNHTHIIGDVTGLQTALDAKQNAATALTTSTTFGGDVSGTYNAIVVADDSHNHIISNVDGLQTALDGKASTTHTHAISDVTDLQTALDGKAATSHSHGYITSAGAVTTSATIASGDAILIADASASTADTVSKGIVFGTSTTTFLREDGTWATPAGGSGGGLVNNGTGTNSTAVGDTSTATATNSSSFGYGADATSTGSVAIGANTSAGTGLYATVVGTYANATGEQSIAIGGASAASVAAQATGLKAIAIGYSTDSTGESAIAIGDAADATALDAIQLGTGTNATASTLQVFNYQLLDASGNVPFARHGVYSAVSTENDTPTNATWEDTGIQLVLDANSTYYIDGNFGVDKPQTPSTCRYQISLVINDATTGTPYVRGHFTGAELNSSVAPKLEYVNTLYTTDAGANATFETGNVVNEYTGFINFQGMIYTGTSQKTIKFRHRRTNSGITANKVALDSASAVAYKLVQR